MTTFINNSITDFLFSLTSTSGQMSAGTIVLIVIAVIWGIFMILLSLGFPIYVLYLHIRPPGRNAYIEKNAQMREHLKEIITKQYDTSSHPEIVEALIACSVASVRLRDLFEESIIVHGEIKDRIGGTRRSISNLIYVHRSGLFARGVGLYSEKNRIIKHEWKPNREIINKLMTANDIDLLDDVMRDAYNCLPTGDAQIKAIKQWRKDEHRELRAAEREQLKKTALFVGVGAIALVALLSLSVNTDGRTIIYVPVPPPK